MFKSTSPALLYSLVVAFCGFVFGYDASVISGAISFISEEFHLEAWQQGFIVSVPTLGATLAMLFAGLLCDKFGRRRMLICITLLYLVSAVASMLAVGFVSLAVSRFIGGIAYCSLMVAPLYIAEITPAKIRGKMVSCNQLNIMLGLSAAYFTNYYILQQSQTESELVQWLAIDQYTWRWMLGLELIPAFILLCGLLFIPKSPRWLVAKGQLTQAKKSLLKLGAKADLIEQKLIEVQQSVQSAASAAPSKLRLLFSPKLRLTLLIALTVGIGQQITGVNAIYFYAPSIFEQSGIGTNAAFAQAIWIGLTNVLFTFLAILLIDKLGRRPLLILGLGGVFISMSICSIGFKQATYELNTIELSEIDNRTSGGVSSLSVSQQLTPILGVTYHSDVAFKSAVAELIGERAFNQYQAQIIQSAANINSSLILIGIIGFVASFAFSLGPVMWVLFSEIFPNHIRGIAISFVGVINSSVSFVVQFAFPWEISQWGAATTFAIYGIFAVIALIIVVRYLPETKVKTLEQIEAMLTRSTN